MVRSVSPATGVPAIAAMIALCGLTSLGEGWELLKLGLGWAAVISLVIGLLLINRAYGLWKLRFQSYEITLVLLVIRAVAALLTFVFAHQSTEASTRLIVVLAAILYLIQPNVRALFRGGRPT